MVEAFQRGRMMMEAEDRTSSPSLVYRGVAFCFALLDFRQFNSCQHLGIIDVWQIFNFYFCFRDVVTNF